MKAGDLQLSIDGAPDAAETAVPIRPLGLSVPLLLVLLSALWVSICAIYALQIHALGVRPWATAVTLSLLDWGPWIVLGPVVIWLAWKLPISHRTWRRNLPAHVFFCLLAILLIEGGSLMLVGRRQRYFNAPGLPGGLLQPGSVEAFKNGHSFFDYLVVRILHRGRVAVPVYCMLVAAAHAIAQQRRSADRERRALKAEARLAEARLQALQAQFKPHFLFNTLNTMAQLVYENPAGAESMITSLSELLRTVLAVQERGEVPLAEEIAFIERYLAIQRVRYGDRLNVHYDIAPEARPAGVPALLLQPLVENAIVHGIALRPEPGTVFIRGWVRGSRLHLEVADTGRLGGAEPSKSDQPLQFQERVGLGGTRARLAALFGLHHTFAVTRAVEGGVTVHLEMPFRSLPA